MVQFSACSCLYEGPCLYFIGVSVANYTLKGESSSSYDLMLCQTMTGRVEILTSKSFWEFHQRNFWHGVSFKILLVPQPSLDHSVPGCLISFQALKYLPLNFSQLRKVSIFSFVGQKTQIVQGTFFRGKIARGEKEVPMDI